MRNKVLKGDCLELMKGIPDGSVDMILCDLPYGTTACKWDSVIPFEPLWEHYKRIIKKNGVIVLTATQPFTTSLISSNMEMFKYCWVWDKKIGSNFASAPKMPLKITEDIVIFGGSNYYPQKTVGKLRLKGGGKQFVGIYGDKNKDKISKPYLSNEYHPTNIIQIGNAKRKGKNHPTQKPVALFEYLIKTYTKPGELVLDNCAGSGTTAIACINTERDYILMEQEEKYFEIIKNRIEEHIQNSIKDFF